MSNVIGITKDIETHQKSFKELYLELLYCVEGKYENETRHDAAKRIIIESQNNHEGCDSE